VSLLVLALAGCLTFRESLSFGFLAHTDDELHVSANPQLLPPSLDGAAWFWTHAYAGMYIPVSYDFWMLEAELAGGGADAAQLDARVFRAGSLALHVLAASLVFLLLRRWLGANVPALLGALAFELHPLQVESVAWISETRGLLAAVFGIGALLLHASGLDWLRASASCALLALAMLSKPSAASIPLIALVADRWLLQRSWRESLARLAPWFAVVALLSWVAKQLQPDAILDAVVPWVQRPWIAGDAAAFYLRKLALPLELVPDHGRTPARVLAGNPAPAIATGLLCAALLVLRLPGRHMARAALLIFLAGLAPVLGLVPFAHQEISTVASRFAYLALIGPALGIAALAVWLQRRRLAAILLVPIACAGVLSARQVSAWRDTRTAFERNLVLQPSSHQAHALVGKVDVAEGDLDHAYEHFEAALRLGPDPHEFQLELGNVRFLQRRLDDAVEHYQTALATAPGYIPVQRNLARAWIQLERWSDAQLLLERLHERDPRDTWAARQLARVHWHQGDLRAAAAILDSSLKLQRDNVDLTIDLTWLLATARDPSLRDPERASLFAGALGELAAPRECERLWVLAAASAVPGSTEHALNLARRAATLAAQTGRAALAQRLSEWIAQVERGELPADLPPLPDPPPALRTSSSKPRRRRASPARGHRVQ
jgi:tetratricopeptide (TPR) repeat protein